MLKKKCKKRNGHSLKIPFTLEMKHVSYLGQDVHSPPHLHHHILRP